MDNIAADVAAIARIDAVPKILEVVCRTTGMRFAAVARVTAGQWVACGVRDEIQFGLQPGRELKLETTICNEIRANGERVVIDHVAADKNFCRHPTPAMYGFQSYISVPIRRPNGEFFGTLCAIDPLPARLNTPEVIGMFELFADMIGLHLDWQERETSSEGALRDQLTAIETGVAELEQLAVDEHIRTIVARIRSSAWGMSRSIDDLLELVRRLDRSQRRDEP